MFQQARLSSVAAALLAFTGPRLGWLSLLLLALAAWARTVHGGWVNVDTPWLVVDNPILSSGDPHWIAAILGDMSQGTRLVLGAEYLPVRDLSVLLDFALFGPRWAWHHLHSLAWYLGACLLFLRLCRRLLDDATVAWLAAAIFALHPVHLESVAWLASRKDVLALFFFLLAVLLWLQARGRAWATGAAVLAYALAVWSKNTAIVLPLVLVLISLLHLRERASSPRWWLQWLPFGAVTLMALGVSLALGQQVSMYAEVRGGSTAAALLLETRVVLRYLGLVAWPAQLSLVYPEPVPLPWTHPASLVAAGLVLASLVAVPLLARRRPLAALGIAWFYATLLPVSQLVPIQNLMADRYLLLPLAGCCMVAADLAKGSRGRLRQLLVGAGALACLLLGASTVRQAATWHSSVALWSRALERAPDDSAALRNLAGALDEAGERERAVATLERGLRRLPGDADLLAGLGLLRLKQGQAERAEELLGAAWQADSSQRKAASNLVTLLLEQERSAEAIQLAEALVATHPLYATGWNTYGAALMGTAQLDAATQALERALSLDPFYATPACNLALITRGRGQHETAAGWRQRCEAPGPEH